MVETDPKNAANRLHDESSDIATKMYEAGLRNKVNMILDGTMKNAEKYERFIQAARENGYSISVVIADVSLEKAYRRADIRYKIERRLVPREIIRESHRNVPLTFKRIQDKVDSFDLYDTTSRNPQPFYVKDHGKVLVKNVDFAILADHRFLARTVPAIARRLVFDVMFLITQLRVEFSLQHGLQRLSEQLLQRRLYIFQRFQIIVLNKCLHLILVKSSHHLFHPLKLIFPSGEDHRTDIILGCDPVHGFLFSENLQHNLHFEFDGVIRSYLHDLSIIT
jgi:predicted ABC-type ATPase